LLLSGQLEEAAPLWAHADAGVHDIAASIMCATALRQEPRRVPSSLEPSVSREFSSWNQRLVRWGAHGTVASVNENVQALRNTLPTAATALEAALAEARSNVPA